MTGIYDFEFNAANGNTKTMGDYQGKVLLLVNTASKCGFTPQFEGLENLNKEYADQGLEIVGFPCNQFGKQDPGNMEEITEFCQLNYGVSFTMAEKIDVNGAQASPLFEYIKDAAPGLLGSKKIKWNFTKFLVNRDGEVVERFAPATTPEKIAEKIKELL
ncbi:MAG: glutathione peroxidase [Chitinophagales bacterium]|jgi:glutathione peroxidase